MTVVQFKQQSFHALVSQTKACWDRADQKAADADQWMIRTGKLLVELKEKAKADGERWLDVLKKLGRSRQRADELMQLATGEATIEQQRERTRKAVQKSRAKKVLLRNSTREGLHGPGRYAAAQEGEEEDEPDGTQEFVERSLSHLCGEMLCRRAALDREHPGWRKEFKCPSHIKTLMKEAATEFAALITLVTKM